MSEKGYEAFKPCWVHSKVFIQPKPTRLTWFLQWLGEPREGLWVGTSSGSHSGGWTRLQVPNKSKIRTSVEVWALHQHHPKASHAPRSLCRSCILIASMQHEWRMSCQLGHLWQQGMRKSFVFLFWRAVVPCRCSAGSFTVLISHWRLQNRVWYRLRWDPDVALVSCLSCAPSKRTGGCLKWNRDLLLSYTELCVFHVAWCGSFSLPISSLPIRMTFLLVLKLKKPQILHPVSSTVLLMFFETWQVSWPSNCNDPIPSEMRKTCHFWL